MYTLVTDSGAMIYILSFIKTGSGIQKLMEGIHRHIEGMVISKAYFIFKEYGK
jgi:hypothetical protein